MTVSDKAIKLLWANAAGRCSFAGCRERLTIEQAVNQAPYTLGEMAHIKGEKAGSNRYDSSQTNEERNCYENLILLCPNHHTLVDKSENACTYSAEILTNMKITHEISVSKRLEAKEFSNVEQLKNKIAIYLAENKQAWHQYGPVSDAARRNPHSNEIYAIWTYARLSTIVPNNRIIISILEANRNLFDRQEQNIISQFLDHAMSYEHWVKDEISYQSVMRFPADFEHLIIGT